MRHRIWLHHLLGTAFAFILSVSTVGCLITGFDLPVDSMGDLIIRCGAFSLISALLYRFRFGAGMVLCLSALLGLLLWRHTTVADQIQTLLLTVTTQYHMAYDWPAIGADAAKTMDLALLLPGWWTAISVSFYFCRRKHIMTALPAVILPVVVCMIVTNTVPDEIYLYLLIFGAAMLLLTDWVRRNNQAQGISLTLRMAVPVILALAALFYLNPRESYVNNAAAFQKNVVNWFLQLQTITEEVPIRNGTEAAVSQRLNLRNVGPRSRSSHTVMRVSAPVEGILYLRGQDYDTYTGTGWEATQNRSESFPVGINSLGRVSIISYGTRNVMYFPYYTTEAITLVGGCVDNTENLQQYSYELAVFPVSATNLPGSQYLDLPEDSLLWAEPLAEEITSGCESGGEKIRAIGEFVRNSATYDLSTSRMSNEAEDFARWFLEESDTGYCVHFATAATVLLRAAGIPTRYVEGYMISSHIGEETLVSNQDAHAWAEYFDPDTAVWTVLEATPSIENDEEVTESSAPTEPGDTEPDETQTEPPLPTESEETRPLPSQGNTEPAQQKKPFKLPDWVKVCFGIMLAVLAVIAQANLRINLKRKIWNRGEPNEIALNRWKQSASMARVLKIPIPEELDGLAQKARFSQHTLSREELMQFEHFRREALQRIRAMPWYCKFFLRWILAIR